MRRTVVLVAMTVALAACGVEPAPGPDPVDTTLPARTPPTLERVEPAPAPVTGEVPDEYLAAVLEDAAERTGLPVEGLVVIRSEFVEWSDGSLGCPEPGMMYTQAIVPGYRVEVGAGDGVLDYRLDDGGRFRLCEADVLGSLGGGVSTTTGPPDS
jgi:hypothetical protein